MTPDEASVLEQEEQFLDEIEQSEGEGAKGNYDVLQPRN
jgi:hypothetical protein